MEINVNDYSKHLSYQSLYIVWFDEKSVFIILCNLNWFNLINILLTDIFITSLNTLPVMNNVLIYALTFMFRQSILILFLRVNPFTYTILTSMRLFFLDLTFPKLHSSSLLPMALSQVYITLFMDWSSCVIFSSLKSNFQMVVNNKTKKWKKEIKFFFHS